MVKEKPKIQVLLVHRRTIDQRADIRREWVPAETKVGDTIQVEGDTRFWKVEEICNGNIGRSGEGG